MKELFGASWVTSLFGYLVLVLTVVHQALQDNPIPTTSSEWAQFLFGIAAGIGIKMSKDANVSHAPFPTPEPNPVDDAVLKPTL